MKGTHKIIEFKIDPPQILIIPQYGSLNNETFFLLKENPKQIPFNKFIFKKIIYVYLWTHVNIYNSVIHKVKITIFKCKKKIKYRILKKKVCINLKEKKIV